MAAIVVAILVPVLWFRTTGEKWATLVFAAIPIVGLVYWLCLPAKVRAEAKINSKLELNSSRLGRAWNYFMWVMFVLAGLAIVTALFMRMSGL